MMAETLENGVIDMAEPESAEDGAAVKQINQGDDIQKQNGLKNHQQDLESSNDGLKEESQDSEATATTDSHINTSKDSPTEEENGDDMNNDIITPSEKMLTEDTDRPDQSDSKKDNEKNIEQPYDENMDSNLSDRKESSIEKEDSTADSISNSMNMDEQSRDASERMDVDESPDMADESSNVSAASGLAVKEDLNSKNPSIVSEDSSRDSVDTIDSKSDDMDDSSMRDGLVSKVKDADGGDILITLNKDETGGDKDTDESNSAGDDSGSKIDSKKEETKKEIESNGKTIKNQNPNEDTSNDQSKNKANKQVSLLSNMNQPVSTNNANQPASSIAITSGGQTYIIQSDASIPVGVQLVQQGTHLGYITQIGSQSVFVPVSNLPQTTATGQPSAPKVPKQPPIDPENLKPKSSLEMIELMKWEIQNRIPDNSNWSVAFHPKKEELSAITSFLLELGHDVVKEAVYKDIIQIQTKKKTSGELKDNEIESLDKMKTVYENTRKKVEHLQVKNSKCNGCDFRTESATVMTMHKDFPHFDPPWDISHGLLMCAHCNYKTKAAAQFSFHMSAMHKAEAKLPDKISCFQCELCPLNTTTKNKLDKHRAKCMKHFKMNINLHPYYHDVNFCMKTCYYKPKKPVLPKPMIQPKPQIPQPSVNTPITKRNPMTSTTPQTPRMISPINTTPRPGMTSQGLPRPPPLQQMQALPPKLQQAQQQKTSFSHARPSIATARSSVPPAPRTPQQPRPMRPPGKEMSGFEVCELCGGYVKDRQALRIHFYYAHKVEMPQAIFNRPVRPLTCEVCQSKFWTTQGLTKHKTTLRHYSSTATSSSSGSSSPAQNQQCFMCMRRVSNLFIHIENVHGMTMKDLVAMRKCIICGITAADRKNLETHMATAHGVLIKANEFLAIDRLNSKPTVPTPPTQPTPTKPTPPPSSSSAGVPVGKNVKPSIKQNLCVFCQLQFADNIQLTMHCIKNHATCSGCGMVVQSNKHLSNHNCRQMKRHCDICGVKDVSPDTYVEHVRKVHMKPCKVEMEKMSNDEIYQVRDKIKREYKPQIISLDSEEDSDVELVDSNTGEPRTPRTNSKNDNKENVEGDHTSSEQQKPVDQTDKEGKNAFSGERKAVENSGIENVESRECNGGRSDLKSEPDADTVATSDKDSDESGSRKRKLSDTFQNAINEGSVDNEDNKRMKFSDGQEGRSEVKEKDDAFQSNPESDLKVGMELDGKLADNSVCKTEEGACV